MPNYNPLDASTWTPIQNLPNDISKLGTRVQHVGNDLYQSLPSYGEMAGWLPKGVKNISWPRPSWGALGTKALGAIAGSAAAPGMLKPGGVIDELKKAKGESDRKNYSGKHRIMRKLMDQHPEHFHIDSQHGAFVGVSHHSGFRMHLPRKVVPESVMHNKAAASMSPMLQGMISPRKSPAKKKRIIKPVDNALAEPSPTETFQDVAQTLSIQRSKQRAKLAAADIEKWREVPGRVRLRMHLGAVAFTGSDNIWSSADSMVSKLATAALALPKSISLPSGAEFDPVLDGSVMSKYADIGVPGTGIFTPNIQVDSFNNAVWNSYWHNPFGERSQFGTPDEPLHVTPEVAAFTTGIVSGAGAARKSDTVSIWDIGLTAAQTAGVGWLGGLAFGKALGLLAGLNPQAQQSLTRSGLYGGAIVGATKALFGNR